MDNIFDYTITPIFGLLAGVSAASTAAVASYPYVSEWMSEEAVAPAETPAPRKTSRGAVRTLLSL